MEKSNKFAILVAVIFFGCIFVGLTLQSTPNREEFKQVTLFRGVVVDKNIIDAHYTNTPSVVEGSVREKYIPTLYVLTIQTLDQKQKSLCVDSLTYESCELDDTVSLKMKIGY